MADADTNPVQLTGQEGEVCHKDERGYYAVVATTRPFVEGRALGNGLLGN